VAENFGLEHLRFLTDKLSNQTTGFKAVNLRLEALIEIAFQLASESKQSCLLEQFCKSARALMSARYAIVSIAPKNGQDLDHLCASGVNLETYSVLKNLHASYHVVARLMEGRQPFRRRNPGGNPEVLGFPARAIHRSTPFLSHRLFHCIALMVGSPIPEAWRGGVQRGRRADGWNSGRASRENLRKRKDARCHPSAYN
jgi:hypothetical protein